MINKNKKLFVSVSLLLMLFSVFVAIFFPANISPEFSGSSELEINFSNKIEENSFNNLILNNNGEVEKRNENYLIKTDSLTDEAYIKLTNTITNQIGAFSIIKYESFSPIISKELKSKSIIAILIASLLIVIYVSYAFRGVSYPVESYKYGVVSTIALLHDVLIPFGVFALISPFTSATIDTLFITALLAILGYSINDTIVIFDRIREVLKINKDESGNKTFEEIIDISVKKSIRRSVYTSLSTMIPLLIISIFVPITKWFAFTLFIGILTGTYSSLFFAPSLLLYWHKLYPSKQKNNENEKSDIEEAEDRLREVLRNQNTI